METHQYNLDYTPSLFSAWYKCNKQINTAQESLAVWSTGQKALSHLYLKAGSI